MSDEKLTELEARLEEFKDGLGLLKWIASLGWCLLAGAFALGVWVATLEIRTGNAANKLLEHDISLKNHGTEINSLHVNEARVGSDLSYIKSAVERIEKRMTP